MKSLPTGALLACLAGAPAFAADLTLTITGIAHGEGRIHADAWTDAEAFSDPELAQASAEAPADPAGVTLTLTGLADKPVAVIVYHDEDGDGEMDRFMGMWPTEGYAVSNDPEIAGPPEFEPAAIPAPLPSAPVEMTLTY